MILKRKMIMGRPKLSDEEKARRAAERKVLKKIQAQQEFEKARLLKQEQSLLNVSEDIKQRFLEVLSFFNSEESKNHRFSEMALSIYNQWKTWGNLSVKQINAIIKWYDEFQETLDIFETITDFFEVGKRYNFKNLHVECKEAEAESSRYTNSIVFVYKILLTNKASKICHIIKTSSIKIYNKFLEVDNQNISINAEVKWIIPDSRVIMLSSKGIKVL